MKKKKLLITGAAGFVGGHVLRLGDDSWDVVAVTRREMPQVNPRARHVLVDLFDDAAVEQLFAEEQPTAVIHCAAIADIDFCERNCEAADAINVEAVERIARQCWQMESRLIHCSTDNVFDGETGMYREEDTPLPVNYYGQTKLRAEEIVKVGVPNHVIARVAIVMGVPVSGSGNAFLGKLLKNSADGVATPFPANERRTPIDVVTLANALLELAGNDFTGTLHLAGNSRLNRHEMGLAIAKRLGIDKSLIEAGDSNAAGRATRPPDVSLDNTLAKRVLKTPMRPLDEGIEIVLGSQAL